MHPQQMFRIADVPTQGFPPAVDRSGWSDAAIAAEAAARALDEGRYQLGFSFARIALDANRAHAAAQHELSAVGTPHFDQTAQQAQNDLFGNQEDSRQIDVPRSTRCVALVNGGECHAVLAWRHATIGDADTAPRAAGWYHLDPANDGHVPAVPADLG